MAQKSGLFDSTYVVEDVSGFPRGDKAVDASFFAKQNSTFYSNGIAKTSDDAFWVSADGASGLKVKINPGYCLISGYVAYNDEQAEISFDFSGEEQSWIIAQKLDFTNPVEAAITLVKIPVSGEPSFTITTGELWFAKVVIPGGTVNVTQQMITDYRTTSFCGWITTALIEPAPVPEFSSLRDEPRVALSETASYVFGTISTITIAADRPTDNRYYAYDISFDSGATATTLSVPSSWEFVGQDSVDGVFVPAPNSHYEMVGAWHNGILRWVVLAW